MDERGMSYEQYFHGIDDVDVAFARLERVAPPAHLRVAILLAIAARVRARRRIGYLATGGALVLAAATAFFLGQQLRMTGALALAEIAVVNLDLFLQAPSEFALAVGELVPWPLVAPFVLYCGALVWGLRLSLTPGVRWRPLEQERALQ